MAHENAKKNARNNAARLFKFRIIAAVIAASCFLLDAFVIGRSATWWGMLLWVAFWGAHNFIPLFFLTALGKPDRNPATNEIIDCVDLSDPKQLGIYSYAQDVLWFCWFLQPLQALFSNWFMLLYLPIPGYAGYKLFSSVLGPLLGMGGGGAMGGDEAAQQQQQQQMGMQQQMAGMPPGRMSARATKRREERKK